MNDKKHADKLQKSSGLFMQLGLVLTLAVVYALFEHTTEITKPVVIVNSNDYDENDTYLYQEVQIERKAITKKGDPLPKAKMIDDIIKSDDSSKEKESVLIPLDPDGDIVIDITNQLEDIESEPEALDNDNHLMMTVQEVPIFPGCEKGSRDERKACFEKKVGKFISRKFNNELASTLGLPSGKQKIYVQFTITKSGAIEIKEAKAAHKRLEKEGKRVVNLLPEMIPGKQDGKPVNVSYMVPIVFQVQ